MESSLKMCETIKLSPLGKTWILDLDGTLVKHNGYKLDGRDTLLPGAKKFLSNIDSDDMVIILTSRSEDTMDATVEFLHAENIRYDHIIWNAPYGERIIVNDRKPSGLNTAVAVNTPRDSIPEVCIQVDTSL